MNVDIELGRKGYFATFIFAWAGITCFIVYAFLWDLHFLTGAIALIAISFLMKKAEDWSKVKEAKKKEYNNVIEPCPSRKDPRVRKRLREKEAKKQ